MIIVATRPNNTTKPTESTAGSTNRASTNQALIDPMRMVLFPARAFLALGWIRAGVEKLIEPTWWDGTALRGFVASHDESRLPFLDVAAGHIGSRTAILLTVVVLLAEFGIGACLVTARKLPHALGAASALNITFVMFGAVTPSAFYLVLQMTLLLSLYVRRPHRSVRAEVAMIAACVIAAIAATPFIRTVEPHAVIEDPAIMLATLAMLGAATMTIIAVEGRSRSRPDSAVARSSTSPMERASRHDR